MLFHAFSSALYNIVLECGCKITKYFGYIYILTIFNYKIYG